MITFETLLHRSGCDIDNALNEWKDLARHDHSTTHLWNLHPRNHWQRLRDADKTREEK